VPLARRAVCGPSRAAGIRGASRLGLAVPRREPPVRAVRYGTQRITGVRGRGWCLIPAVPLNLQCRPGGPIMAPAASPASPGPCSPAGGLVPCWFPACIGPRHCTA